MPKVNAMTWLVPLIRSHLESVADTVPAAVEGRRDVHANLRSVIRAELLAMGSDLGVVSDVEGRITTQTPQEYLFALDRVRRCTLLLCVLSTKV